jgi:hypothetical protein
MQNASKTTLFFCLIACLVGLVSANQVIAGNQGATPTPVMKAREIKCPELRIKLTNDTNCAECVKDHPLSADLAAPENANSPIYVEIPKNQAYYQPPTKAGDGGHLLMVDLVAPGKIISVVPDCHGYVCGWVHGCDGAFCQGHNVPMEYHGDNTARWWGWSNSGDNAALVFAIHFQ